MKYRFRLTIHHASPGLFRFDDASKAFALEDGLEISVFPRDVDTLSRATRFHLDGRGFADEATARVAGERLRVRFRVLNALLGLGITVPRVDGTSGGAAATVKEEALKRGHVLLDTIIGLAVYPDDDRHLECVVSGEGDVHASDPTYIFTALKYLWSIDMTLDDRTQDALEILSRALSDRSPRAKFLMTYLAAEHMIDRPSRSDAAKALLSEFQERIRKAGLDATEAESLCSAIGQLHIQSFRSALLAIASQVASPPDIAGLPLAKFLSVCVDVRNDIAHHHELKPGIDLQQLSDGLRRFVLMLMWTRNKIPDVAVAVPPSQFVIPQGGLSIKVM